MKLSRTHVLLGCLLFCAQAAVAADYQPCTSIKGAKDRLACFDKYAASQNAESVAAASEAKQASELKARKDTEIAQSKATILAEVDRFKAKLTERFKDPSSAKYRNVVAYGASEPLRISFMCGEVNSKNSYGAYTGFKRFFMIGDVSAAIEDTSNTSIIDTMWPKACKGDEVYRQE